MCLKCLPCMVSVSKFTVYNAEMKFSVVLRYLSKQAKHGRVEDQESIQQDGIAYLYILK